MDSRSLSDLTISFTMRPLTLLFPCLYFSSAWSQGPLIGPEAEALTGALKDSGFSDMGNLLSQIPVSDLTSFLGLLTGNFTLLLPSSIPNGTVSNLLANTNQILPLLSYHVVTEPISNTSIAAAPSHSIASTALKDNQTVFLGQGAPQTLALTVEADGNVHILDQASDVSINKTGSLHIPLTDVSYGYAVINNLLSVPVGLVETLQAQNLMAFASSASTSGVMDTISGQHGVTIFVPSDAAFASANSTIGRLNSTQLAGVVNSHVLNGTYYSTNLGASRYNVAGQNLSFNGGSVSLPNGNTAKVVTSDVLTSNGVVHVIDTVLLTDSLKASIKTSAASGALTPKLTGLTSLVAGLLFML
ncbi:Fasciclin-domain-containing protein [Heliocybe sulcata]|uniref:Fasciclin-domain-containing protein n=1 Tax=Heliocybe sulcata TaxID=5364 RepID=A0A5C3MXU2_9AGAM|nr:Fasciclin-domain-containing protein [Heliocybe sulcata]